MTQAPAPTIKAIALDAYAPLFDICCMKVLAEEYFPDWSKALIKLWRQKLIDCARIRIFQP